MARKSRKSELLDSLVDLRDVKIDRSQPIEERKKSYVEQIGNPYLFKVGDVVVRLSYSNTQRTLNEAFSQLIQTM